MMQFIIFVILSVTVSTNALTACKYDDTLIQDVCPGNIPQDAFQAGRMYESQIKEFLDVTLRETLRGMNGSGRLPELDPLTIGDLGPISLGAGSEDYQPLTLQLWNVTIENLLGYEVYNGSYQIMGFKIPIGIDFPRITVNGRYDLAGWLGEGLLYLEGSGNFNLSLIDVSLYVELDLGTNAETKILVLECIGIDFNVGGAECNLENLLGGGYVGDMLNGILADTIPTLLNLAKDNLIGRVVCPLRSTANKALDAAELTMDRLLCVIGVRC